jgi:glyoxylase-like metal-dependent hydrolase (beta-lactamase superfamily II)
MVTLQYEVVVSGMEPLPESAGLRPPTGQPATWSPMSSTLIYGPAQALLTDPPVTADQAERVADRVAAAGRDLVSLYVTHGHGDHWYGTATLLERFPGATVYATEGVIAQMHKGSADGKPSPVFDRLFPGRIPDATVVARPVPRDGLLVDGEVLLPVEAGHSDTDDTTVLHVPSIGLVVAGDVIYNNVHQYLAEAGGDGLAHWLTAVGTVEALDARHIVAGHKDPDRPDDPAITAETRAYLEAAGEAIATGTRRGYFDRMVEQFPDRLNPTIAWLSAIRLFAE